eukprot:307873-Amphidinium_carterae.2
MVDINSLAQPPPFEDRMERAHVTILSFLFSPLADYMQLVELHTDTGRQLRPLLPPGGKGVVDTVTSLIPKWSSTPTGRLPS